MKKSKGRGHSKRGRARKNRIQNVFAMLGISFVVCLLFVVLLVQGQNLRLQTQEKQERIEYLQEELQKEEERSQEIDALKEYMEGDEYIEKYAQDKIGLIHENEILFKESD